MKKISYSLYLLAGILIAAFTINSCVPASSLAGKSGAQLWGENCQRCHNTPPPAVFNNSQWDVVGVHMRLRANLTQEEEKKIIDFLKSAN